MITATPQDVLKLLRQLPPRERLQVIYQALPEIEQSLSENVRAYKSLRGLWKDLLPSISAEDIDESRRDMWKNFPREEIV